MSWSSSSLYAMAHGDERGGVARRRLNDQREALSGTDMIESGGYTYPNKSICRSAPKSSHELREAYFSTAW